MSVAVRERVASNTSALTHTATFPTYVPGDYWLWIFWTRGTTGPSATPSGGWTRLDSRNAATSGSAPHLAIYARAPTGDEGASGSITLTNSGNARSVIYALTGADLTTQYTNTTTNTNTVGAGRQAIQNTSTTVAPTVTSFGNTVAGSLAVQVAAFCANTGVSFDTTRADMAVDYRQVNSAGTTVISAGVALSTTPLPAGATGTWDGSSDQTTRWVHTVVTIAPAPPSVTYWNGSAWVSTTAQRWDGTAWQPAPLTVY